MSKREVVQDILAKCYVSMAEVDNDLREWRAAHDGGYDSTSREDTRDGTSSSDGARRTMGDDRISG